MTAKRLRWMMLGAGIGYAGKWKARRAVATAAEELEGRLPKPLADAAAALPIDIVKSGGAVMAAGSMMSSSGRSARKAVHVTSAAVVSARRVSGRVGETKRQVEERVFGLGSELRRATDDESRRLLSEYLRHVDGEGAAVEVQLDRRPSASDVPLPEVPGPVPTGRHRHRPALAEPAVNRVQRSYRRPQKPWERATRRR